MDSNATRLATAFALHDAGVDLMRNNLRRRHPQADEAEIQRRLDHWLQHRPGAQHGDGPQPAGVDE